MLLTNEGNMLSEEWLCWLCDFAETAKRFTEEEFFSPSSEEELELFSVKMALYARALTLFEGSVLLIENNRQLDFRIHSRGVIEAAMYLIALDGNPAFVVAMKDDDFKSRQKRAGLHLNAKDFKGTDDVRKLLADFVAQGVVGVKSVDISALVEKSEFERLYRSYRDISGDAAHVSLTALNRHYNENPENGTALLILHPALDDVELQKTVVELGISMTIATLMLMKIKQKTDLWDEFRALTERYRALARSTPQKIQTEPISA